MMIAQQLYEGIELPGERSGGRSHHLHAHRLGARVGTGHRRRPPVHRRRIRRRVRPREAELLQDEGRRAGRARSDPADVDAVPPRRRPRAADAGSVLPLPADLEPLRRVADDAGAVRRDDGRHHGGRLPVPRQGLRAEVCRAGSRSTARPAPGGAERPSATEAAQDGRNRRRRRRGRRGRRGARRAAGAHRRADARRARAQARAEVHAAAAALQRRRRS